MRLFYTSEQYALTYIFVLRHWKQTVE